MKLFKRIILIINLLRLWPHILVYLFVKNRFIKKDIATWSIHYNLKFSNLIALVYFLSFYPEFRNVFYFRFRIIGYILNIFCPKLSTLYITTSDIGEGFFIQHGFATIISAKSIGTNCWINQQVTIGYSNDTDCPTIGNYVKIYAGAKVIGAVTIGDNSIVGANCVVVKNVPENAVVVGVPARIIKLNGEKVDFPLT